MAEGLAVDTSPSVTQQTASEPAPQSSSKESAKPKNVPHETSESLAEMKRQAHLKFDEATKARKEAEAMRAEAEQIRQEALSSKSEIQQFIELSQTNPRMLEKIYGPEAAKKIAEDLLYGLYEEEKLTPEQKAARDQKAQDEEDAKAWREYKKKTEEDDKAAAKAKLVDEKSTEIDSQVSDAIKEHNLPKTPITVKRIAQYLLAQMDAKVDMAPSKAAAKVREDFRSEVKGYVDEIDIAQLVEEHPELIAKLRKFDMKKSADVPSFQTGFQKPQSDKEDRKQTKEPVSIDEFFKRIG